MHILLSEIVYISQKQLGCVDEGGMTTCLQKRGSEVRLASFDCYRCDAYRTVTDDLRKNSLDASVIEIEDMYGQVLEQLENVRGKVTLLYFLFSFVSF